MSPTRIVIVGGGVAGVDLATRIGRRHGRHGSVAVTLIDRNLSHVWKPMLHTFAAGTARPDREQVDFLAQAKRNHFVFIPGHLNGIDRATRTVSVTRLGQSEASAPPPPLHLDYDRLVLAVGSRANDFGTPGVIENCLTIDGLEDAQAFRERLRRLALGAFRREEDLDVAIIGGGATGVELSAELKHAVDRLAAYGSPSLPRRFRLALIESGPRLLPAFPDHVSEAAADTLRKLDVDVRLNAKVTGADGGGLHLGRRQPDRGSHQGLGRRHKGAGRTRPRGGPGALANRPTHGDLVPMHHEGSHDPGNRRLRELDGPGDRQTRAGDRPGRGAAITASRPTFQGVAGRGRGAAVSVQPAGDDRFARRLQRLGYARARYLRGWTS